MPTDDKGRPWTRLYQASDGMVRSRFTASIALAVGASILVALAPLSLKFLVDSVAGGTPLLQALPLAAAYFGTILAGRCLGQVQAYLFATGDQRLQQRLAIQAFDHLLRLPMEFHLRHPLGSVLKAHGMMLHGARLLLVHALHTLLPVSVQLVTVLIVVATLFNSAAWLGLAVTALAYALVFAAAARWQARSTATALKADLHASAILADGLVNIEPVKASIAEAHVRETYESVLRDGCDQWNQASARRMLTGAAIAILYVAGAGMIVILATSGAHHEALSIGSLVLLFTYLAQVLGPLEAAGFAFQDLAQVMRYFEDWDRIASVRPERTGEGDHSPARPMDAAPPAITFDNVTLAYASGREVLSAVSFDVRPGQVTAIVGPSGSGKTSIIRALVGFCEPVSGEIRIGARSTRDISLHDLRSQIAIVSQDSVLFHATLRQNLQFPLAGVSTERLSAVIDLLRLNALVERLPAGLDTCVGERGQQLSGGERQRVAVARALIRQAPILVLDEPTSALDPETEEAVRAALFDNPHRRTSLLVTHRLELAARADRIVLIMDGRVEEEGTHEQLLALRGAYANLWRHRAPPSGPPRLERGAL